MSTHTRNATDRNILLRHFGEADLSLELTEGPFVRGAGDGDAFALDIQRARKGEWFRMFPGPADNRVQVLGRASGLRQLVLLVKEPRRRIVQTVRRHGSLPVGARVISSRGSTREVEFFTSEVKRHYLCGNDEQHLFIAQLPRPCSTVRAAHVALEAPALAGASRRGFDRPRRQGEWFFIVPTQAEIDELEGSIRCQGAIPRRKVSIAGLARDSDGRRGNQHIAGEGVATGGAVYVRGPVRHPEHATLKFRSWRRVFRNQETPLPSAIDWVD